MTNFQQVSCTQKWFSFKVAYVFGDLVPKACLTTRTVLNWRYGGLMTLYSVQQALTRSIWTKRPVGHVESRTYEDCFITAETVTSSCEL